MLAELEVLDYKKILYYFSEISGIPHGSGNVYIGQGISYLMHLGDETGISYRCTACWMMCGYR